MEPRRRRDSKRGSKSGTRIVSDYDTITFFIFFFSIIKSDTGIVPLAFLKQTTVLEPAQHRRGAFIIQVKETFGSLHSVVALVVVEAATFQPWLSLAPVGADASSSCRQLIRIWHIHMMMTHGNKREARRKRKRRAGPNHGLPSPSRPVSFPTLSKDPQIKRNSAN